jgi:LCP family protein required for cell wall assembly
MKDRATGKIGIIPLVLISLGIAIAAIAFFYGWKILQTAKKIQFENPSQETAGASLASFFPGKERVPLKGEENGRINILLLGRAGEKYPGKNLTDTVMLASIDTKDKRIGFLSLPRDLSAPIQGTGLFTKLNSLYQYGLGQGGGIDTLSASVKEITGQPVHYFIILDFDSFEKIVDTLGGVSIYSERDILDTRYPGKNYSYETFALSKGWHTLDGKTALKYVRERHDDPQGDFGRAKRQQETIQAIRKKAFSLSTFLNPITISKLLGTLGDSVKTNITIPEIGSFAELAKTVDTQNPSRAVVDAWQKKSLLRVDHVQVGAIAAFILVPRAGNWNEVRALASDLFSVDDQAKRDGAIAAEHPSILILSHPEDASDALRLKRALTDIGSFGAITTLSSASFPKQDRGGIMDRTGTGKPYSLDELLKLFDLDLVTSLPTLPPQKTDSPASKADFILLYGSNMKDAFASETTLDQSATDQASQEDSFSDYLAPQAKKK